MAMRALLLLLILSICWSCSARDLGSLTRLTIKKEILSVLNNDKAAQHLEGVKKNEQLCTLCEEFASDALGYLSENKTQTEIIEVLHKSCSRIPTFKQQCIILVDYYAPLFFLEVSTIQAEDFCRKVDLCQETVIIPPRLSTDKCDVCHSAVTEALLKLKDPDTQLEILEVLLKACNSVEGYAKKCKKLIFEYAPVILVNAEQFLEKNDICKILHACESSSVESEHALPGTEASMHAAF